MATRAFVYSADQVISKLPVAKDTNLPEIGERTFYIIAEDKVYKAVSHKSQMADEPYEIQILNYLSEKVMAQFISLYEAKDISKTD